MKVTSADFGKDLAAALVGLYVFLPVLGSRIVRGATTEPRVL